MIKSQLFWGLHFFVRWRRLLNLLHDIFSLFRRLMLLDTLLKASLFRSDSLELFLLDLSRQVLLRVSNRRVGRVRKLYFLHFLFDGLLVHHRLEFVECLALQLGEVIGLEHELFFAGIVLDQVLVAGVFGVED